MWGKKLKMGIPCLSQGEKPLLRQFERNKKPRKEWRSAFVLTGPGSSRARTAEPTCQVSSGVSRRMASVASRVQRSGFVAREKIA